MTNINKNLYCSISDNMNDWATEYHDAQEFIEEIVPDIRQECQERGYDKNEIEEVVGFYKQKANEYMFWDGYENN
jgi:hypothetical protein